MVLVVFLWFSFFFFLCSGDVLYFALFSETNLQLDCRRQKRDNLNCCFSETEGTRNISYFIFPPKINWRDWGEQVGIKSGWAVPLVSVNYESSTNQYFFWIATPSNHSLKARAGVWELHLIKIDSTHVNQGQVSHQDDAPYLASQLTWLQCSQKKLWKFLEFQVFTECGVVSWIPFATHP